jgi:hypothetical protein
MGHIGRDVSSSDEALAGLAEALVAVVLDAQLPVLLPRLAPLLLCALLHGERAAVEHNVRRHTVVEQCRDPIHEVRYVSASTGKKQQT